MNFENYQSHAVLTLGMDFETINCVRLGILCVQFNKADIS